MKKEIIKSFDLEAYEKGAKVKTRNGREVRIVCTDRKNQKFPIIALVKLDNNNETYHSYTSKGRQFSEDTISDSDLVIVEEVDEFWSDNKGNTFNGFRINNVASIAEVSNVPNTKLSYDVFATKKQAKSARAMARISQIMANDVEHFGGVITDEEWKWENGDYKYVIYRACNKINTASTVHEYHFLAFHTEEQRNLFLKKYRGLVREYLMLD